MAIVNAFDYIRYIKQNDQKIPNPNAWIDEMFPDEIIYANVAAANPINKPQLKVRTMFEQSLEILNEIPKDLYSQKSLTGSYYITDKKAYNDIDYILYTEHPRILVEELTIRKYKRLGNGEYPEGVWASYRQGPLNIIITDNYQYYIKFCAATQLARVLDLQSKAERIKLFDLVLTDLNDKVVF